MKSTGSGAPFLNMPAGGSRLPASAETVANRQHYVKQEGQQVFKYAVKKMADLSEALLAKAWGQAGRSEAIDSTSSEPPDYCGGNGRAFRHASGPSSD